ncbi:hypothetical protein IWX48DRAFT_608941 [Phyllosticta citricarpa]
MFSSADSSNLVTWENMSQEPSSPTLTNPDLILPDLSNSLDSTPSPQLHPTRPPSPPAHLLREPFRLAKPSPGVKPLPSRPPTSYTHSSHGASTDDGDTTPQRLVLREHDMKSSSSLRAISRANGMQAWQTDRNHEADDRHNHWPGFDGPLVESDTDGTDDASSKLGNLPYVAGSDEETDTDLFNDGHEELDLEAISSAALSKRAEMILANAKKRLNLMEGNLRGARQSLLPPPRPKYNSYIAPKRPSSVSPIPKGQGPFYIPQAQHAARSNATTPGHTRRHSEVSDMSQENTTTPQRRAQRAVSAMGSFRMQWPQTNPRQSMITLRGAKSQETIRHTWVSGEQQSYRSMSRGSTQQISPTLETLKEDEATQQHPTLHRSASTASELRSQMQTLNRRISTLRERAREEHLKRRSLQNLHDSDVNGYHWDADDDSHQRSRSQAANHSNSATHAPRAHTAMELRGRRNSSQQSDYDSRFEDADEEFDYDEGSPQAVRPYGNHHNREDREINGDDGFEDADQVLSERHEDRADAFDYENFFLHSALGTYRAEQQRSNSVSSASSEDSVETTRPTSRHAAAAAARTNARTPPKLGRQAVPNHQRQKSAESISSITTFQTATEGRDEGSDADIEPSEDDDEQGDEAIDHHLARSAAHAMAIASKRSNQSLTSSASGSEHLRSAASSYSPLHLNSSGSSLNGSSPSLQSPPSEAYFSSGSGQDSTARIMATFFAQSTCRDKLTPLAQKDEDLLYALTTSIQQVCARLQNAQEDAYEMKIWRRRLDAARKILDGVPEEIQM